MSSNLSNVRIQCALLAAIVLLGVTPWTANAGLDGLTPVPFEALSDRSTSLLGAAALSIRHADWKHAESTNFIYHYFNSFVATPVSVEKATSGLPACRATLPAA